MRRRSPTNSRPSEDLAYRQQYRDDPRHAYDELLRYFPTQGCGMALIPKYPTALPMHGTDAFELHHAWGRAMGNPRWDRKWNLVAVCRPVHAFVGAYRADGIVLCLRLKVDKGEWDHADAKQCLGFDPYGWLEMRTCEHQFAETIRRHLLEEVRA